MCKSLTRDQIILNFKQVLVTVKNHVAVKPVCFRLYMCLKSFQSIIWMAITVFEASIPCDAVF